ncbi:hypothetical protein EVG20_g8074, partial [Dentipellis fragilis]
HPSSPAYRPTPSHNPHQTSPLSSSSPRRPHPPLLASPDVLPALNAELYDFIALSLRAFVNPWWTKITRYDKEFLSEITRILTTVIRVLELRISSTDFTPLVCRDLPTLLTDHCIDHRAAQQNIDSSYALGGSCSLATLFHARQQHIGVTPEGKLDETYVRTAIEGVLKLCLPQEDWESEPERYIIREALVRVVCRDVAPRITEPWFIHKLALDLLGPPEERDKHIKPPDSPELPSGRPSSFITIPSFQTLVVFFLSAVQTISSAALTFIHLYKQTLHTIKAVNHAPSKRGSPAMNVSGPSPSHVNTPIPSNPNSRKPSPAIQTVPLQSTVDSNVRLAEPPVALLVELFDMNKRFASNTVAIMLRMFVLGFSPFLDRLLPHYLYSNVFTPTRIVYMVQSGKRALFPNGYPAPSPPDPTPEEQMLMRAALAETISRKVPGILAPILLGPTPEDIATTLGAVLDPFGSKECNTHLFILVLDLLLGTLFPELQAPRPGPSPVEEPNLGAESEEPSFLQDPLRGDSPDITPPGSMPP